MGLKARSPGARLAALIPELFAADVAYTRSLGLEPVDSFEESLGPPASAAAIAELERSLGRSLPPSYRAFLQLHDGWAQMPGLGGADLLGTAGHRSRHVQETLRNKSYLFDEFAPINPIAGGAIPLAIGDDRNMLLLEPPVRDDGEMTIGRYYLTEREDTYLNLVDLFSRLLDELRTQLVGSRRSSPRRGDPTRV